MSDGSEERKERAVVQTPRMIFQAMPSPVPDTPSPSSQASAAPAGAETIQVFARVRPFIDREDKEQSPVELKEASRHIIGVSTPTGKKSLYQFDQILSPDTTQEDVFRSVLPLITAALNGYNTTIAAYGQTGTGKTHTMLGVDMWTLASSGSDELSAAEVKSVW